VSNIEREITFPQDSRLILHDSQDFCHGSGDNLTLSKSLSRGLASLPSPNSLVGSLRTRRFAVLRFVPELVIPLPQSGHLPHLSGSLDLPCITGKSKVKDARTRNSGFAVAFAEPALQKCSCYILYSSPALRLVRSQAQI